MKKSVLFILILCVSLLNGCSVFDFMYSTKKVTVDGLVIEYNKNVQTPPNNLELIQRYHFIPREMLLRSAPSVSSERVTFLKKAQPIYLIGYAEQRKWLAVASEKGSVMLGYIENEPTHFPIKVPAPLPPPRNPKPPCIKVEEIMGETYCENNQGTFVPCTPSMLRGKIKC